MAKEAPRPQPEPKKDAVQLLQNFLDANKIALSAQPAFLPRDDNTFSVVVQLKVEYKS